MHGNMNREKLVKVEKLSKWEKQRVKWGSIQNYKTFPNLQYDKIPMHLPMKKNNVLSRIDLWFPKKDKNLLKILRMRKIMKIN